MVVCRLRLCGESQENHFRGLILECENIFGSNFLAQRSLWDFPVIVVVAAENAIPHSSLKWNFEFGMSPRRRNGGPGGCPLIPLTLYRCYPLSQSVAVEIFSGCRTAALDCADYD